MILLMLRVFFYVNSFTRWVAFWVAFFTKIVCMPFLMFFVVTIHNQSFTTSILALYHFSCESRTLFFLACSISTNRCFLCIFFTFLYMVFKNNCRPTIIAYRTYLFRLELARGPCNPFFLIKLISGA